VISGLFYGGGQRVVLDLLSSLPGEGAVDPRLCLLGECENSPLSGRCVAAVPYDGRYNSPAVLLAAARRLRKVIADQRPDLLHTHGVDADLIGALAGRRGRTPQVCHLHISPPAGRKESWKAAVRRRLLRWLTRRNGAWFIAVSEAVRQEMAEYYRLPPERIVTVRNGIDPAEFDGCGQGPPPQANGRVVLGTAARLAAMKGLEFLIEAAAQLKRQGPAVEVRIAGTGGRRERLEQLAADRGVAESVRFLGQVTDMPAFYRELDAFVLPSVSTEGLPLVVLEAMAARRPVVATRVGGTAEAVRDGVDGILVPPGDAGALAAALARLAASPAERRRMGDAGRQRVENDFCVERVAREVAAVYERVLAEGSAGRAASSGKGDRR
jgi:glycosyltransferase involved in cell wall biosynthesis